MHSADGTRRARPARSRCAGGGTWSGRPAQPSASAAGEGVCIARTARGVLVLRDRDAPAEAHRAAARRCPLTARLGMGECSLRARTARGRLVTRDRDAPAVTQSVAARRCPPPALLRKATAERGRHTACRPARSRRAGSCTWCCRSARPSASAAGESDCRARGQHAACSSHAIVTRWRRHMVQQLGAVLHQCCRGRRLQGTDDTLHACHAGSCRGSGGTLCGRSAWPSPSAAVAGEGNHRARTVRCVLVTRRAGGGTWCGGSARPSASAAGEGDCRAQMTRSVLVTCDRDAPAAARGAAAQRGPGESVCRARTACCVLVSRDRDAPAAAHGANARRCPPPARLGGGSDSRARWRAACLSRAIATRQRRHTAVQQHSAALHRCNWEGQL